MSGTPCVHMPGTPVASLLPVTQKLLPGCISLPHGLSSTDKIIFEYSSHLKLLLANWAGEVLRPLWPLDWHCDVFLTGALARQI